MSDLRTNKPKSAQEITARFRAICNGSTDWDRIIKEEGDSLFRDLKLNEVKPVNDQNLPDGSLQFLARLLGKSPRQVRRLCEKGFVSGAKQTKGGHWRIPPDPKLLEKVKAAIKGKTRNRRFVSYAKLARLNDAQQVPELWELKFGKGALEMGPDKYNAAICILNLVEHEKSVTVAAIACAMRCSRAYLYRKVGKDMLNEMIRPFKGYSKYDLPEKPSNHKKSTVHIERPCNPAALSRALRPARRAWQ
jgi:hypothetical protein